ncbi:MAG: hypothetical protein MN733_22725 [Nitrososphaera sp.]|nr:hypothetical protein [Nitrososphaera sp.]
MGTEASVIRFDQGGASKAYVPNIFTLTESGRGGELDIDALARTEQTFGASELAGIVLQEVFELQWYFFAVASFLRFKTSLSAPFATLLARPGRVSREDVDSPFCQIENQIRAALEADPIEDGYSHPAEALLEKAIRDSGRHAGDWLSGMLSSDRWSASFRAGLLRLLSRQTPLTEEWRLRVIQLGLSSPNIELRDAAVQAAESWEGAGVMQILQGHREPCTWLADYISRVIQDLWFMVHNQSISGRASKILKKSFSPSLISISPFLYKNFIFNMLSQYLSYIS